MSATGLLRSRNHLNLRSIAQWVEGVGKVGFFCFVFLFFFFFCCYCIEVPRSLSHRVVKPSMALLPIELDIVSRALSDQFFASIRW